VLPKVEDTVEVEEQALTGLSDQGLLDLAHRLGIVTNETQVEDRESLLREIQQQVLKT
jgi:hypothetical protein